MRFFGFGAKKSSEQAQAKSTTAAARGHSFNPAPRGSVDNRLPRSRSQGRKSVVEETEDKDKCSVPDAELKLALRRVDTMAKEEVESKDDENGGEGCLADAQRRLGSMVTQAENFGTTVEEEAGKKGREDEGALVGSQQPDGSMATQEGEEEQEEKKDKEDDKSKDDEKQQKDQDDKLEKEEEKAVKDVKEEKKEKAEKEKEHPEVLPDLPEPPESLELLEPMKLETEGKEEKAEKEKEHPEVLPELLEPPEALELLEPMELDAEGKEEKYEKDEKVEKGVDMCTPKRAMVQRANTMVKEDSEMERGLIDVEQKLVFRRVGTMAEEVDDLELIRSSMRIDRTKRRHSSCPAFTRIFDDEERVDEEKVDEEMVTAGAPAEGAVDRSFGSVAAHDVPSRSSMVSHDARVAERSFGSMVAHAGGLLESDVPSDDESPRAGGDEGRDRVSSMVAVFGGANEAIARSFLQEVRSAFGECDRDGDGEISREELARAWAAVTEGELGRSMDVGERELLALSVQRAFREMDVDGDGRITVDEWVHHALLDLQPPGSAALEAITKAAKSLGAWSNIAGIVRQWEKADVDSSGTLSHAEVAAMLRMSSEEEAQETVARMKPSGATGDVSYAEFCAYKLGLKFVPVELYLYDLSASVSKYFSPILLGKYMEGIWHSSIVVFGIEYYLFGYLEMDPPGTTHFGKPTKTMPLGYTLRSQQELNLHLRMKMTDCTPEKYDLLRHNCNHAAERIAQFLLGRSLPDSVRLMSERLVNTPIVRVIEPLVYKFTGGGSEEDFAIRQAAIAAKARPDLRRSRSLTNLADRRQIDNVTSGAVVLYTAPEMAAPVMARVLRKYKDGSSDVSWFDGGGICHRACRVPASSFQKQKASDRPRTRSYVAVEEALQKRSEEGRRDSPRSCALIALPSTPVLEVLCSKGHTMVRRSGQSAWGRAACAGCCLQELGSSAPYFYGCKRCNSNLCPSCAEAPTDRA